jgi:tetratricopeptide (TPR) repeat protein
MKYSFYRFIILILAPIVCAGASLAQSQATPVTFGECVAAGKQAFEKKEFKAAEQYFSSAIKVRPEEPDVYIFRAEAYVALGKNDSAIKDYTQVLKLNPNNALAYYNRGTIYLGKDYDYKKALKDFDALLLLAPKYVNAYINRSLALMGLKRYEDAEKDLDVALKLAPQDPGVYRALAVVSRVQGKAEVAQAYDLRAAMLERQQR